MENYQAMIRNTFDFGSVRDAEVLFETCIKNAFPTNTFRRLELIRFIREEQYMEGRSWNHVFEIKNPNGKEILSGPFSAVVLLWANLPIKMFIWTTLPWAL